MTLHGTAHGVEETAQWVRDEIQRGARGLPGFKRHGSIFPRGFGVGYGAGSTYSGGNGSRARGLRRNTVYAPNFRSALQQRLEKLRIFTIHKNADKSDSVREMSLRDLYNYVMRVITMPVRVNSTGKKDLAMSLFVHNDSGTGTRILRPSVSNTRSVETTLVNESRRTDSNTTSPDLTCRSGGWNQRIAFPSTKIFHTTPNKNTAVLPDSISRRDSSKSESSQVGHLPSLMENDVSEETLPQGHNLSGKSDQEQEKQDSFKEQQNLPELHGIMDSEPKTRRERLGDYLHPRDMRRLVTPFSASNEPELMIRRHVMLLNFDQLRAIVLRDRLLVILPPGADESDEMLTGLSKRVRGGVDEVNREFLGKEESKGGGFKWYKNDKHSSMESLDSLDGDKDEGQYTTTTARAMRQNAFEAFEKMNKQEWENMTFELQCVDAVLYTVYEMMSHDTYEVCENAEDMIDALIFRMRTNPPGEFTQEKLRILKDDVVEMEARVRAFVRSLTVVLDRDDEMALMNLTHLITHPERFTKAVSEEVLHEESDEPELIMETYLQQALSQVNELEQVIGHIDTTEELVSNKLDTVRNRLLYINTLVSLLSLCVAIGSFIGSIFGMNLQNFLETDEDAFRQVVVGTVIGCIGLLVVLLLLFHKSGTLPSDVLTVRGKDGLGQTNRRQSLLRSIQDGRDRRRSDSKRFLSRG